MIGDGGAAVVAQTLTVCYIDRMKTYIHARLSPEDRAELNDLKRATGHSESELVRHGLRLVRERLGRSASALALAGHSTGRFKKGPKDLSTNARHLDGFGT